MMGASETLTAARELTPRDRAAARRKAILSCSIGNFLELFDFVVFGFFAATIGRNFFPSTDPTISLLSSFATYGVGFVMRPVGAMLLGAYGDRHGRKGMLIITISLMAVATGGMAVVPPYAVIGIWAPVLLLACRLLQGFATGGEWGAAATFLVEYAEPGRRGLTGSFQQIGFGFGMIGGTLSAALVNGLLSPAAVESWGWRIPFVVGCFIAPVAVYIRSQVAETPLFRKTEAAHHVAASPLGEALRLYWREVLTVAGIGIVGTVAGYICNVFLPPFRDTAARAAGWERLSGHHCVLDRADRGHFAGGGVVGPYRPQGGADDLGGGVSGADLSAVPAADAFPEHDYVRNGADHSGDFGGDEFRAAGRGVVRVVPDAGAADGAVGGV